MQYKIVFEHSTEQKYLTYQEKYLSLNAENSWMLQDWLLAFG